LLPPHEIKKKEKMQKQPVKKRIINSILDFIYLSICFSDVIFKPEGGVMQRIKDAHVERLVEQIGEHYRSNISNRFLRPLLLQLPVDKNTLDLMEIITEKIESFNNQGFHLDELYRQIAACARFADIARNGMPSLKNRLNADPKSPDKILRDMAANNFASNLKVFTDLLNELYITLVDLDKHNAGKNKPVFSQIPELANIDRLLAGSH
jgi:hypothetical protein